MGHVLVWPFRENIICRRAVGTKHVERTALGDTFHYCFVTFGLRLLVVAHGHRCGQKSKACIDRESSCAWSVSKKFSLLRLAALSWCLRPTKERGSPSHIYKTGVAISSATPFLCPAPGTELMHAGLPYPRPRFLPISPSLLFSIII